MRDRSTTGTALALALPLGGCTSGGEREATPVPYVTPSAPLPEPPASSSSPPPSSPSSSPRPASRRPRGSPPAEGKGGRDPGDVVVADSGGRNNESGYETEPPRVDAVMTVCFGGARRAPQVFGNVEAPRTMVAGDHDGDGRDELLLNWRPVNHVPEWGSATSPWWVTDGGRDENTFDTGNW